MTACLWRTTEDTVWRTGSAIEFPASEDRADVDGAEYLFAGLVDRSAEVYVEFARDMHEVELDAAAVGEVLALRPLSEGLLGRLVPGRVLGELIGDLSEIGYPY
ncbi:hypothetical protein [Streptomyces lichenis]|uniref:hypothetical protein n=1 Tax=Streptomyces lichenis TaxID=2306967 RepID=UPI0027E370DE|nr:hypothetical protein [Streptomyces lichenis]